MAEAADVELPRPGSSSALTSSSPEEEEASDADDEAAIEQRIEEDSAPLRQLHDAELEAHVREEQGRSELSAALPQMGFESPLRMRLRAALRRELSAEQEDQPIAGLPELRIGLHQLRSEYDIPIDVNDAVVAYVRFFQSPKVRPHFVKWLSRSHRYIPRFREILREEGVPEDTVYLAMIESGFANLARSRARAVGAWQFIEATGRRYGLRRDFWVDERRDPEKAARSAARFLKALHGQTGDWRLAWAGYNGGPGRIARAMKGGYSDFWEMAAARRVLPRETAAYVPKLMAAAIIAKRPEAFGFSRDEIEPHRWTEYEAVSLNRKTELSFVAQAAQVPVEALLDLNPELRRTCTPPRPYSLKIPRGRAQVFAAAWPRLAEQAARRAVARHQVRRGESLAEIARAYDVPVSHVAGLNHLDSRRHVRPGTVVAVPIGSVPRREAEALARRYLATATTRVRIASGDTLWGMARRHGVSVHALAAWNGIRNPARHKLHAGRYLVVRKHGAADATAEVDRLVARADHRPVAKRKAVAARRTVRVRSGDSLWSVARRFGVSIFDLARWNSIPKPQRHRLRAGSTLIVRSDWAG